MSEEFINTLYAILKERKGADPEKSYVASLYEGGVAKIIEKIQEETQELAIEAQNRALDGENKQFQSNFEHEAADLLFHFLVLLANADIDPQNISDVLKSRFGTSGHCEKANRPPAD